MKENYWGAFALYMLKPMTRGIEPAFFLKKEFTNSASRRFSTADDSSISFRPSSQTLAGEGVPSNVN